jgi:hypothetical protein
MYWPAYISKQRSSLAMFDPPSLSPINLLNFASCFLHLLRFGRTRTGVLRQFIGYSKYRIYTPQRINAQVTCSWMYCMKSRIQEVANIGGHDRNLVCSQVAVKVAPNQKSNTPPWYGATTRSPWKICRETRNRERNQNTRPVLQGFPWKAEVHRGLPRKT